MTDSEFINVEVVYALPHKQKLIALSVPSGTTAFEAAEKSGITEHFPELELEQADMGIFGQTLGTKGTSPPKSHVLQAGERVEIYRPLLADPKEVRRRKAAEKAAAEKEKNAEN